MPATSATHLVFFIAAMVIAASLVGAFYLVIDNLNDAMVARSEAEQRSVRSRVEIINDLVAMPYNNTSKELTVYVKNTGAERLDPNQTVVFIDGLHHNSTWRLVGGGADWAVGATLELTVKDCYFTAGSDHGVKVVCDHGASDRKTFSIRSLP